MLLKTQLKPTFKIEFIASLTTNFQQHPKMTLILCVLSPLPLTCIGLDLSLASLEAVRCWSSSRTHVCCPHHTEERRPTVLLTSLVGGRGFTLMDQSESQAVQWSHWEHRFQIQPSSLFTSFAPQSSTDRVYRSTHLMQML